MWTYGDVSGNQVNGPPGGVLAPLPMCLEDRQHPDARHCQCSVWLDEMMFARQAVTRVPALLTASRMVDQRKFGTGLMPPGLPDASPVTARALAGPLPAVQVLIVRSRCTAALQGGRENRGRTQVSSWGSSEFVLTGRLALTGARRV